MPAAPPSEPTSGATSGAVSGALRGGPVARRVFDALARLQTSRPLTVLFVAFMTALLAGFAASRLKLKTSLGELLPADKESVIVAEQVRERLVSSSTLYVVARSRDTEALKRFVNALTPELRALPPGLIGAVDDGVRDALRFFEQNKVLYAPLEDVQKVHDEIRDRYEREIGKAAGYDLGLDDDDGSGKGGESKPASEMISSDDIREKIEERKRELGVDKYPDGYYLAPEGDLIAVVMRTPVSVGDVDQTSALLARIRGVIDEVGPTRFAPDMRVDFSGSLITSSEEYSQIKGDLTHVGMLGVGMILGVVFLFYLRVRTLLAMTLTVGIGVAWTFGLTYLLIGHLNSSTGFLASIIVGNGINFGIIYMARYFEARAVSDLRPAVLTAHLDTWRATLAAAAAASVAYGSLMVTDFRGFKHFGVIGGMGMILCWLATYLFLPSILVVLERASRAVVAKVASRSARLGAVSDFVTALAGRARAGYGRPFAWLAERYPRTIAVAAVLSGLGAVAVTVHYVASDPMEYDMRNTRTQPKTGFSLARELAARVGDIAGRGQDGLAIMVDRLDQVAPLRTALEARRDAAPPGHKPFERVADIFDLLPKDQDKKIELLEATRDRLERAHRRGLITERDWQRVVKELPEGPFRPLGVDDLPEQVARLFVEKDGTRGRLVYIVPSKGRSVWDGRYLREWADSFRETTLPDGSVIRGSGTAVIFADVLTSISEDAPKAILVSLLATILIIVVTFRGRPVALAVMATLVLGLAWMTSAMALRGAKISLPPGAPLDITLVGMKLNFLNFIALPITIGVGADYAINVMQRHELSRRAPIREVITTTGGAVILCSLTTMLGYFGLTFSINRATQSFGFAAAAGEVACVVAAVLVLPAFLVWRGRRRERGSSVREPATSDEDVAPGGDDGGPASGGDCIAPLSVPSPPPGRAGAPAEASAEGLG